MSDRLYDSTCFHLKQGFSWDLSLSLSLLGQKTASPRDHPSLLRVGLQL